MRGTAASRMSGHCCSLHAGESIAECSDNFQSQLNAATAREPVASRDRDMRFDSRSPSMPSVRKCSSLVCVFVFVCALTQLNAVAAMSSSSRKGTNVTDG